MTATKAHAISSIRLGRAPNCSSLGNLVNTLVWSQAAVAAVWVAAEAWKARRIRPEPGGGRTIAVDEPPALVRTGEKTGAPHEAHVQVTSACPLPCANCHVEASKSGSHVPLADVAERFEVLANEGVFHVAIGGGEALGHPDLPGIAQAAHAAGLTIGLTTSGVGDLSKIQGFDQVNVSYDGGGHTFTHARGYAGAPAALTAIRTLVARGLTVGVNILVTRSSFTQLETTISEVVGAGVRDIHLLRLKPAGRALRDYEQERMSMEQGTELWPKLQSWLAMFPEVNFRVDCALTPFIAAHGVNAERMRQFGWLGCHGGDALVAVHPDSRRTPCSFSSEKLDDLAVARWRIGVQAEPCGSCGYRELCRGGCHAVAGVVSGESFAPDPECPLVLAAAFGRAEHHAG